MSSRPYVDTSKPHSARVYDYMLGGKDNYRVDQELAKKCPEFFWRGARQNRAFMHRAVAWSARKGIRQFLDIGTGIPTEPNLHQIAQEIQPSARIVYTDNDPIVLRHAEALLVGNPQGTTNYIHADLHEPHAILTRARDFLDFDQPITLTLIAVLHFILDDEHSYSVLRTLVDALPSGSHLVIAHGTFDQFPEAEETVNQMLRNNSLPVRFRSRAEIVRYFDGLDLVEPGVVIGTEWYRGATPPPEGPYPSYVGVARVP